MISAPTPRNTSNMTNESIDIDTAPTPTKADPPRRSGRRARNTLSNSLNLGTTTSSSTTTTSLNSQRAQEASLKSSFVTDRRTGLSETHGRLSQSFIESSGEGLDDDTIKDILKGFEDGGAHVEYDEQDEEEKGGSGGTNSNNLKRSMSVTKPMRGGVRRGGRRNMLESIESQKSMHFNCDGDE